MTSLTKRAYIISDLHLGGSWPTGAGGHGFRMMTEPDALADFILWIGERNAADGKTELIINGDFTDFLAEEHEGTQRWIPFIEDPQKAVEVFNRIANRQGDKKVFDALGKFVERGHDLTILLGNH